MSTIFAQKSIPWVVKSLFAYIVFSDFILPTVSLLRVLNVGDSVVFRNIGIVFFLLLFLFSVGVKRALYPHTGLQRVLLVVFLLAAGVGLPRLWTEESYQAYCSHLFQLVSFYLLVGVGFCGLAEVGERFWKSLAWIVIGGVGFATLCILLLKNMVDIPRFYTPAYPLLLAESYFIHQSIWGQGVAWLLLISSNKRGVILACFSMTLVFFFVKKHFAPIFSSKKYSFASILFLGLLLGIMPLVWEKGWDASFAPAVEITMDRLMKIKDEKNQDYDYSSGRWAEVEKALESIEWYTLFLGKGAGWTIELDSGESIHNIHITPFSLYLVYGAFFPLYLYAYMCHLLYKLYRYPKTAERGRESKIFFLYLLGALIHSLVAYSLFVDLLIPLFLGGGARWVQRRPLSLAVRDATRLAFPGDTI